MMKNNEKKWWQPENYMQNMDNNKLWPLRGQILEAAYPGLNTGSETSVILRKLL